MGQISRARPSPVCRGFLPNRLGIFHLSLRMILKRSLSHSWETKKKGNTCQHSSLFCLRYFNLICVFLLLQQHKMATCILPLGHAASVVDPISLLLPSSRPLHNANTRHKINHPSSSSSNYYTRRAIALPSSGWTEEPRRGSSTATLTDSVPHSLHHNYTSTLRLAAH